MLVIVGLTATSHASQMDSMLTGEPQPESATALLGAQLGAQQQNQQHTKDGRDMPTGHSRGLGPPP